MIQEDLIDELIKRRDENLKDYKTSELAQGQADAYTEAIKLIEEYIEVEEEERYHDEEFLEEVNIHEIFQSLSTDETIECIEDGLRTAIRIAREKLEE